jgi:hypothetical protein
MSSASFRVVSGTDASDSSRDREGPDGRVMTLPLVNSAGAPERHENAEVKGMARHRCGRNTRRVPDRRVPRAARDRVRRKPDTREEPAGSLFDRLTDMDASRKPHPPSRRGIPPWSRSKPRVHRRFQGRSSSRHPAGPRRPRAAGHGFDQARRWEERCMVDGPSTAQEPPEHTLRQPAGKKCAHNRIEPEMDSDLTIPSAPTAASLGSSRRLGAPP